VGFEAEFDEWEKKHLSPYCITRCVKICCDMRNVSLYVYREELERLYDGKADFENLWKIGVTPANARNIYIIESKDFCVKFDAGTRKCGDYENRPKSCAEYPFIVEADAVIIKPGCELSADSPEHRKLAEIASKYGKVIVKNG